jgi:hypothetical protein
MTVDHQLPRFNGHSFTVNGSPDGQNVKREDSSLLECDAIGRAVPDVSKNRFAFTFKVDCST